MDVFLCVVFERFGAFFGPKKYLYQNNRLDADVSETILARLGRIWGACGCFLCGFCSFRMLFGSMDEEKLRKNAEKG